MGALSSWPFMAVVHHIIVWVAAGGRKKALHQYLILGDDIVIFDEKIYKEYLILLDRLGCSYTNNISTVGFEFAKRNFYLGNEITGAYSSALWAARNVPELFAIEWRNLSSRGYLITPDLPESFYTFLRCKQNKNKRKKISRLMMVPYGTNITVDSILEFSSRLTYQSICNHQQTDARRQAALKPIRTGCALLLEHRFKTTWASVRENSNQLGENLIVMFKSHAEEMVRSYPAVFQEALQELIDQSFISM
jgi:hypothetical protein